MGCIGPRLHIRRLIWLRKAASVPTNVCCPVRNAGEGSVHPLRHLRSELLERGPDVGRPEHHAVPLPSGPPDQTELRGLDMRDFF